MPRKRKKTEDESAILSIMLSTKFVHGMRVVDMKHFAKAQGWKVSSIWNQCQLVGFLKKKCAEVTDGHSWVLNPQQPVPTELEG